MLVVIRSVYMKDRVGAGFVEGGVIWTGMSQRRLVKRVN